ncbi:MAG: hypothetical protein H3Z51_00020 [archaeon]|nr:hypothetical protein [archaeon]
MSTEPKANRKESSSLYDLITLLKHVSECDKCRRLWCEIELCARSEAHLKKYPFSP